jgi:hypothetical protein
MDGTQTIKEIPSCAIANNAVPCWQLQSKPVCPTDPNAAPVPGCCATICSNPGDPGQHYGITINRPPAGPPPNTEARVECSTRAVPKVPPGNPAYDPSKYDMMGLPICGAPL